MPSQHGQPQKSWHPDPDEYKAAKNNLAPRGWHITEFLRTAVRWFNADPDRALTVLAPHRPPSRRQGRPTRPADDSVADGHE